MDKNSTFSESWYRIANQRISLRPGVKVRRQNYRGERWIVLENPFSNQYFRLRPAAYEFIARLQPDRTVQEVWEECLERAPDDTPGQEQAIQLLSQLYFSNLLQYELAEDAKQLFERYKKRRQREIRAKLKTLMFMRFPLLDPDWFLNRTVGVIGKLVSVFGALVWLVVVGWAVKMAIDNFDSLKDQTQGILDPSNLLLLYAALVVLKTLHEFGHAYVCKKFGGQVHVMGILLMIFTPIPYMDATAAWGFRERWKRVLVGLAGMIVELFVAAIAVFVWANSAPGVLNNLAYNMIFIASVSTILFNINPLLRFDGYYILSDLLEIPNLHQRSGRHLRHLAERYLFGLKTSESPTQSPREAAWLTGFGIAAGIYRVFVFSMIMLFVADRFLVLGLIMLAICLISWVVAPVCKFINYLATSPRLHRNRSRAVSVTVGLAAGLIFLLQVVPFPMHFRAPGILTATERSDVVTRANGFLEEILVPSGTAVAAGQPLLQLRNPELDIELADARARIAEIEHRIRHARRLQIAQLKPLASQLEALNDQARHLAREKASLVIYAAHDGVWVAPQIQDFRGRWIPRGAGLGKLVNPKEFEFRATVLQEDVDALFGREIHGAQIRLRGQAGLPMGVGAWQVIPAEQRVLPSPALGWASGGQVPVAVEDEEGRQAVEPFFEVRASIDPVEELALVHGRSGNIRFALESEPLLQRGLRRFMQLLQKRYQI